MGCRCSASMTSMWRASPSPAPWPATRIRYRWSTPARSTWACGCDVEENELAAIGVPLSGKRSCVPVRDHEKLAPRRREAGATADEIEFLRYHRVELNAFASDELVAWVEAKLVALVVAKIVPEEGKLRLAAHTEARRMPRNASWPSMGPRSWRWRTNSCPTSLCIRSSPPSSPRSAPGPGATRSRPS